MSRVKTFDSGKFEEGKLINLMQKREKRKNREERKILFEEGLLEKGWIIVSRSEFGEGIILAILHQTV
jgi:hypothetical protein